jgi:hypothetical protein
MKAADNRNNLGRLSEEQQRRESVLLSGLMEKFGVAGLTLSEEDTTEGNNRLLFLITTEMEETQNAMRETEQILLKLKKHLQQLKGLQEVLSK